MQGRLIGLAAIILSMVLIWIPPAQSAAKKPLVRIGIVRDGPAARLPDLAKPVEREILELTSGEFDVRFPPDKNVNGSWKLPEIKDAVDMLLEDPQVDLIVALGFLASNELCQRRELPKPVIAAIVGDAKLQNLPLQGGASGVKNLSYIDSFASIERDIKVFREIASFRHLAFLVDGPALESIPWLRQKLRQFAFEYTIEVTIIGVGSSADKALAALAPETEAVYHTALASLPVREYGKLVYGLIQRRLPSFSMLGREDVEAGILVSAMPKSDLPRLARRVALNVQRILLGEDAGALRVAFPLGQKLTINMATARAIGLYPTWSVLTEAELLNEEVKQVARKLSLESAVREALAANLDLAVQDRNVAAGEQILRQARSDLLPQIDLGSEGVVIDDDRAEQIGGVQPERTLTGSVTGSQLLYSEDAWANFTSEKHLQTSREERRATTRLDIIRNAAAAYLDVLRAQTILRVQQDNLKLTRANLDRARVRVNIGIASRAEEFRWESEIATNRSVVIRAEAAVRQSKNALNRILSRPLEEPFATEGADLSDPLLLVSDPRIFRYVDNPRNFRIYRDFLVEEGLAVAPELLELDAAIAAQERILTATRRAFWLPTFSVEGEVTEVLKDGGKGQRKDAPGNLNKTDWSFGVFATFPLVEGGGKYATIKRAREELSGLNLQRGSRAERVDQRIRAAMHQAGASYPNIQLSRDAAIAAKKNLDLVTDQYVRGVVSIVDLLDAQNRTLVSDVDAENSVYDFLVDLMDVQRASGRFDFFLTPGEREAYFHKAAEFFRKAGVSLK